MYSPFWEWLSWDNYSTMELVFDIRRLERTWPEASLCGKTHLIMNKQLPESHSEISSNGTKGDHCQWAGHNYIFVGSSFGAQGCRAFRWCQKLRHLSIKVRKTGDYNKLWYQLHFFWFSQSIWHFYESDAVCMSYNVAEQMYLQFNKQVWEDKNQDRLQTFWFSA